MGTLLNYKVNVDCRAIMISLWGINNEIEWRTNEITGIIKSVKRNQRNKKKKIELALRLQRQIKRLRIIRAELNLILTIAQ